MRSQNVRCLGSAFGWQHPVQVGESPLAAPSEWHARERQLCMQARTCLVCPHPSWRNYNESFCRGVNDP